MKYFIPVTVKEYKLDEIPIRIPGVLEDYIEVKEWIGSKPFKVRKCCEDLTKPIPKYLRAEICSGMLEGKQVTPQITGKEAISILMKQKAIDFIVPVEMQSDVLCHTDPAFKEELIAKAVLDNWRNFKTGPYKVVGFECPSTLYIQFQLLLRTKL